MTDENPKVSDETAVEELPTPTIGVDASSTSTDADAIVSKIRAELQGDIEKAIQSTKDKRFQKLEDSSDLLAKLKAAGVEVPDDVVNNVRTEQRIEQLEKQLQPQAQDKQGSLSSVDALTDAMAVMKQYQVETNTPEFIALLKKSFPSRDAFDKAVLQHIVNNKVTPQSPASAAGVAVSPATGGAQAPSIEAMTQEYKDKYKAVPKGPSGERERDNLRSEYFKRGVSVYTVDMS